jgi:hypothetical protein
MKNLCAKMRKPDNPYEVWSNGTWTWKVLKKWQGDDSKPYARWFCLVITPMCPDGEYGDVYVSEILEQAVRIDKARVHSHSDMETYHEA